MHDLNAAAGKTGLPPASLGSIPDLSEHFLFLRKPLRECLELLFAVAEKIGKVKPIPSPKNPLESFFHIPTGEYGLVCVSRGWDYKHRQPFYTISTVVTGDKAEEEQTLVEADGSIAESYVYYQRCNYAEGFGLVKSVKRARLELVLEVVRERLFDVAQKALREP